jgi:hypothetical protein
MIYESKSFAHNISLKILDKYVEHSSVGYQMGFSARTVSDFQKGLPINRIVDRLLKRTATFESPYNNGYVVEDPDKIQLNSWGYMFAAATVARWLPICLVQASGIHEPLVKLSQSSNKYLKAIGRGGIMISGEGLYWLGYVAFPGWCKDMSPNSTIGSASIKRIIGQETPGSSWRTGQVKE